MKILSEKITLALEFCTLAHDGQKRKANQTPYASHPISVGFILYSAGYSEEMVIAGILHDVIEDTVYTKEDIQNKFGESVLILVMGVTEDKSITDWKERKASYLKKVKKSIDPIKVLSAADMLDNCRALLRELKKGDEIWKHFNTSKENILEFYKERFEIVKEALGADFKKELEIVLTEIKLKIEEKVSQES